mgnify:CR=1 FL=1
MIQSWVHTNQSMTGFTAQGQMRFGGSLSVSLYLNFENSDYKPNFDGLVRRNGKI